MAELEGNIVEQSAWGKTVELYLYMSLALVCAFLYAISISILIANITPSIKMYFPD